MLIGNKNTLETSFYSSIKTPPEEPISTKEWFLVAGGVAAIALFVAPTWTALGLLCIGPAVLLKKYSHHFSEENQKRINRIYVCVSEIFLLIKMGIQAIFSHLKPVKSVQKGGRPILLVHGYLNNSSAWSHYLDVLPKQGLGPVYAIDLGHPFLPLSAYAHKVKEKAEEIRKQTGRGDLVLIGHSMGGIVSSLYAAKLAEKGSVTDLFTIGSPLSGAPMAAMAGIGPNGREMREGSPLLAEIRQGLETNQNAFRIYHIGSDADTLVPAENALSGCGKKFRVSDLGHTHLLTSKKVSDWVITQLQNH